MSHPETHIVGPARWAGYLLGAPSGALLPDADKARADAWLARELVKIVGVEPGAEPYLSLGGRRLVPELERDSFLALDYRASEISIEVGA